jgi:hypothetical protein
MASLNPSFVAELSAFGSDFEFQGSRYKTIWSVIRGPVRKRRNYKQDWILCDMWAVDEFGAQVDGGDVAIGSDPWTAAVEDTAFDAFISDRIRIGELGMFQFGDDYRPELSYYDVQDRMCRILEQLERKPEYHSNDVWHELFMGVFKQYEFYRERALRESIFFYYWARDCDLCESEGCQVFHDWHEASEWIQGFYESAEGPQELHQMTYEQWRVFQASPVRDRALEQFEEYGYGY